jgi:hypothetical protein
VELFDRDVDLGALDLASHQQVRLRLGQRPVISAGQDRRPRRFTISR